MHDTHLRPELIRPPGGEGLWIGRGHLLLEKFRVADVERFGAAAEPYDVQEAENAILNGGATHVLTRLVGTAVTAFDATNGRCCVGNGTTAVTGTQTDLQGASTLRKALDAAPTVSGSTLQAVATFLAADANFAWQEAGLAITTGTLLNRFLQSFGTKTSSLQWTLTITVTLGN